MIAFETMLVEPAKRAGISVPDNLACFIDSDYMHWIVFRNVQLGSSMPTPQAHWENARVIAGINDADVATVTLEDLDNLGIQVGYPIP